jgi:hypothetical protein
MRDKITALSEGSVEASFPAKITRAYMRKHDAFDVRLYKLLQTPTGVFVQELCPYSRGRIESVKSAFPAFTQLNSKTRKYLKTFTGFAWTVGSPTVFGKYAALTEGVATYLAKAIENVTEAGALRETVDSLIQFGRGLEACRAEELQDTGKTDYVLYEHVQDVLESIAGENDLKKIKTISKKERKEMSCK